MASRANFPLGSMIVTAQCSGFGAAAGAGAVNSTFFASAGGLSEKASSAGSADRFQLEMIATYCALVGMSFCVITTLRGNGFGPSSTHNCQSTESCRNAR